MRKLISSVKPLNKGNLDCLGIFTIELTEDLISLIKKASDMASLNDFTSIKFKSSEGLWAFDVIDSYDDWISEVVESDVKDNDYLSKLFTGFQELGENAGYGYIEVTDSDFRFIVSDYDSGDEFVNCSKRININALYHKDDCISLIDEGHF